jgi:hypothetical protein
MDEPALSQCQACGWEDECNYAEKLRHSVATGKRCIYFEENRK